MNCKVIISRGKERGGEFASQGNLQTCEKGFRLDYRIESDGCTLLYDGKTLKQNRRGNANIEMTFTEGEETFCTLGEGGLCGTMPVYTDVLAVTRGRGGVKVKLNYECGGERVDLVLTAMLYKPAIGGEKNG